MSAPSGVEGWNRYVEAASNDVRFLVEGVASLRTSSADTGASILADVAQCAFRLGLTSLLVGAEEVGRIALAMERAFDLVARGTMSASDVCDRVARPCAVLDEALAQLRNPDKSGARVEGLPLAEVLGELEASLPELGFAPGSSAGRAAAKRAAPSALPPPMHAAPAAPGAPPSAGAFQWSPAVDEDMIELFFDEANERIEGVAGKLLELERSAGDMELLRDLFRDLHTVKGSSAMVGLEPVNRLAHAAEDLVGALREGQRPVDAPVVNALLAALDGLRQMLALARARRPIDVDPAPIVAALRDPSAARAIAPQETTAAASAVAPAPMSARSEASAPQPAGLVSSAAARQTIRVDFDKLDRLLNLVGELVLGRDGLRGAHTALTSVTSELTMDRAVARRISTVRERAVAGVGSRVVRTAKSPNAGMQDLMEELGRVERVLGSIATDLDASTSHLDSISGELRDQVMRLRMIPVGGVFRKHQRTVRDLGQSLGKRVHLELSGEDTELDKLLVEALDEPLMHLVRNAVDHGVEGPADREAAGKSAEGRVRLEASHRGNQVVIRISDDGRGMNADKLKQKALDKGIISDIEASTMDDRAALELIFRPGFSTAAVVSDVSGRGVGMDVVRQTIVTRLKGTIDIESQLGQGSAFILRLPLTLAIIQVLLARVSGETFAIPLDSVVRTLVVAQSDVKLIADREVIEVDGKNLPVVRISHVLELEGQEPDSEESLYVVLTEQGGTLYCLLCDRLVGKKEIVIKSLGELLSAVPCAAGATLIGDRCALILDVPALVQRALRRPAARRGARKARPVEAAHTRVNVLLVDDSDTVRESLRRLLVDVGYDVTVAEDGREALELCRTRRFDIVSTDVMMPHMDGYELTRALRAMPEYRDVPIVMVTSRGERIDRVRGFDAGVDEYITKPHDRQLLLKAIQKLLGQEAAREVPT